MWNQSSMSSWMTGKNLTMVRLEPRLGKFITDFSVSDLSFTPPVFTAISSKTWPFDLFLFAFQQVHGRPKSVTERRSSSAGKRRAPRTLVAQEGWRPRRPARRHLQHLPEPRTETLVFTFQMFNHKAMRFKDGHVLNSFCIYISHTLSIYHKTNIILNEFSVSVFLKKKKKFLTFQSLSCPDLQKRVMQRVERVTMRPNCYSVSLKGVDDLIFSFILYWKTKHFMNLR